MGIWFVYILMTKNWRYYVGSTNNIQRRFAQHQEGKSLATKYVRPVKLLYYQQYNSLWQARHIERQIKKQKNTSTIQKFMDTKAFG